MIILREKIYTKAEKDAFKELLMKTNNLTKLPTSNNTRDVVRFNKFARDFALLSVGRKEDFDKENAKVLLKNVGLGKYSEIVDKMVDKYTNKEALLRLAKQKINNNEGNPVRVEEISKALQKIAKNERDATINKLESCKENKAYPKNESVFNNLTKYAAEKGLTIENNNSDTVLT